MTTSGPVARQPRAGTPRGRPRPPRSSCSSSSSRRRRGCGQPSPAPASISASTPGQLLALEQLQRGAAAGREPVDPIGEPELVQRRDRVAAADHRRRPAAFATASATALVPAANGSQLESAHRAHSRAPCRPWRPTRRIDPRSPGPMSRPIQPSGTSTDSDSRRSASASKRSASTRSVGSSSRQREPSARRRASLGQARPPPPRPASRRSGGPRRGRS